MKEFVTAFEELEAEDAEEEPYISFKIDGREIRAYEPTDGQLAFMLASLGRGQTDDQRFASMLNIVLSTLREDDADYFESRLLTRVQSRRIPAEKLEEIFEFLIGEWFARPTKPQSGSASSPPSDGQS